VVGVIVHAHAVDENPPPVA